ncbi:DNA-binding protein [Chengkuizengella axinellae]|uniref:DNA-binding protein n=1 Tax=Chengkuizengella axinellae TaxID=3064388 RepID=A0ABT9IYC6_9BACL|nr:DNA-binding protein [Chengkuizengella sp. 2205SS18-9]MDP5274366.1 DNA-binding protein [Chengkuizengella sp. 2205SS18-9]
MKYEFNSEEELLEFVKDNFLYVNEAAEFLGCTNQAINQSVKNGKLNPVKSSRSGSLFFRKHLEERKKELEELRKKYRPYE